MGNRAVLTMSAADSAPAIYLHWNGGRASVQGFLQAARCAGLYGDDPLIMDKLADLIARRFFGNPVGFTVYREPYGRTDQDNGDNGVYLIDDNLKIIGRRHSSLSEEIDHEKSTLIAGKIIDNLKPTIGGA